jgi:hypothetical protein
MHITLARNSVRFKLEIYIVCVVDQEFNINLLLLLIRMHIFVVSAGVGRQAGDGYYRTPGGGESTIGERFSTYDRDQDSSATHCAQTHEAGWWYGDCGVVLPTGIWQDTKDVLRDATRGTMWWGADSYFSDKALKSMNMKVLGQKR